MIWHTSYQMCVTHSSYVWHSALHTWYVMCMVHSFYAWFGALHTWCVKSVTHSFYIWYGTLHTWCVWHTRFMCDMAHVIDDMWCVWCARLMLYKTSDSKLIQKWIGARYTWCGEECDTLVSYVIWHFSYTMCVPHSCYGVATVSRIDKIIGLFYRISSIL